jgi:hypothetical protein
MSFPHSALRSKALASVSMESIVSRLFIVSIHRLCISVSEWVFPAIARSHLSFQMRKAGYDTRILYGLFPGYRFLVRGPGLVRRARRAFFVIGCSSGPILVDWQIVSMRSIFSV